MLRKCCPFCRAVITLSRSELFGNAFSSMFAGGGDVDDTVVVVAVDASTSLTSIAVAVVVCLSTDFELFSVSVDALTSVESSIDFHLGLITDP